MKKIVAMALTGIVAAGLLTGCRRGNNNTTTPSTVPSTAPIATVPSTAPSTMPTLIPTMPSTDVTTTPTDGDMGIDPTDVTGSGSTQDSTDIAGENSRSYRRGSAIG